mgnify:FL=1
MDWVKNSVVFTDNTADYHYLLVVPKWLVGECLAVHAENIDYPNFKSSVSDSHRHHAYMEVWSAMYKAYARD